MDAVCHCGWDLEARYDNVGEFVGSYCPRCRKYEEFDRSTRDAEHARRVVEAMADLTPEQASRGLHDLRPTVFLADWHTEDYGTIVYGRHYFLTKPQRAVVRALDRADRRVASRDALLQAIKRVRPVRATDQRRRTGTPPIPRVRTFFRGKNHPLWGKLVRPVGSNFFKLVPPVTCTPGCTPAPRKRVRFSS